MTDSTLTKADLVEVVVLVIGWLLGGVVSCGAFTTYLFFSWYPTYLQEARQLTPELSGRLAGMILAGCFMPFSSTGWTIVKAAIFWIVAAPPNVSPSKNSVIM